jgi:hypothetical protein
MPWVKRSPVDPSPWVVPIVAAGALCVGVLIGYAQWGRTAAVVGVVEKELVERESQLKLLEKRLTAMEAIVLKSENGSAQRNDPPPARDSTAAATRNDFRTAVSGALRSRESHL